LDVITYLISSLKIRDRRMDDVRGGFVLKARSDDPPGRRQSLVEKSSNIKESILKVRELLHGL